ncbi:hypothetical protein B0H15DRAFT_805699 [Mycena belliarum]|uniref:Uncharacterized protein n=1 Tax=Mycena belliarum TaxID=1033014 RepID=A0AAD6TRS9_9AGAR|nr:hypothetical protein B0H15DRAFT_805699 [Mycena belliae]
MPRKGARARKRAREGHPDVKPGKVGWVHGTKLRFFETDKDDYLAALEVKQAGAFYSRMARLYLGKYGYYLDWDDDLEDDDDVASDVDNDEDVDDLSAEEAEERSAYYKKLRAVTYKKIGVWYNSQHGGSVEKKTKTMTFKQLFNKPELEPRIVAAPESSANHQVPDRRYKEGVGRGDSSVQGGGLAAIALEHKAAMTAYDQAISSDPPTTAAAFDVNNALRPIPDRGGRIEVRRTDLRLAEAECRARSLNTDAEGSGHVASNGEEGSTMEVSPVTTPPGAPSAITSDGPTPTTSGAPAASTPIPPAASTSILVLPGSQPLDLPAFNPSMFDPGDGLQMHQAEVEDDKIMVPAGMGKALKAEVVVMTREDHATYMRWLRSLTQAEVEFQSSLARDREVMKRVAAGMELMEAMAWIER